MNTPTPSFKLFRVCEMSTGRIQAFSDGVFSIVMTLLVLEIHVPYVTGPNVSVELARDLSAMMPKFFSYALSFGIVCIWWVAHHHLYDVLRKSDRGLLWFNSLFLFWLAFIPFPTAMLGDYPKERIAVICYGAVMMLAGFSFSWMRYYAFFIGELTYPDIDRDLLKRAMIKSAFNPILHLSAVMLAFVSTTLAITLYVIIPMLFFVPSRLERNTMNSDRTLG
jgi:uncharacterized membrane protein